MIWWLWWPISSAVTLATMASFDTWPAFSKTRRLWGAIPVEISMEMRGQARLSCNRRSGRGGGRDGGRARDGQDRARQAAGLVGTSDSDGVREFARIRPMLVVRSALSGIAVEMFRSSYSHPFRPRGCPGLELRRALRPAPSRPRTEVHAVSASSPRSAPSTPICASARRRRRALSGGSRKAPRGVASA